MAFSREGKSAWFYHEYSNSLKALDLELDCLSLKPVIYQPYDAAQVH